MRLRKFLERRVEHYLSISLGFPLDHCGSVMNQLAQLEGVLKVDGFYTGPLSDDYVSYKGRMDPDFELGPVPHDFGFYLPTSEYFDITALQFHPSNPEVLIMSLGDPRLLDMRGERLPDALDKRVTHIVKKINGI